MGLMHPAKTGLGSTLELIAKRLRTASEDVAHEPLPERWVDLIKYLDEQERRSRERMEQARRGTENPREARRK
jgi:hypothetical protein